MAGEGQRANGGGEKHPLHECDGRVPCQQTAEEYKVPRRTDLGAQAEHISPHVAAAAPACGRTDEQRRPCTTCRHTHGFPHAQFFVQEKAGEEECDHRQCRGDECRVRRGGEPHAEGKRALVQYDAEQTGQKELAEVAAAYVLPGEKAGGEPEQHGRTNHAHRRESHRGSAVLHHPFSHRGHESPHDPGRGHRKVPFDYRTIHGERGRMIRLRTSFDKPFSKGGKPGGTGSLPIAAKRVGWGPFPGERARILQRPVVESHVTS